MTRPEWEAVEQRTYRRTQEESKLFDAYRRRSQALSQPELVLINGPSGTGKTVLANTLRDIVLADNGLFISGKFDQLQTPNPYAPFVAAFTEYANLVTQQGEDRVHATKCAIEQEIVAELELLTDMVPALERIIGPQARLSMRRRASGTQNQVAFVVSKFVRAISSLEQPVVLFLDDLQWVDSSSLDLFEALASHEEIEGFMLLGTCRGNEVVVTDPLSVTLRKLDEANVAISNIVLRNLSSNEVNTMLSNMLQLPVETTTELARAVFRCSDGNIFTVKQLLRALHNEGSLFMDSELLRWRWDENYMQRLQDTSDVMSLVSGHIASIPPDVQDSLQVISCIGAKVGRDILHHLLPPDKIHGLSLAKEKGLISFSDDKAMVAFAHDRFQRIVYSHMSASFRKARHFSVGRTLWANMTPDELDKNVFLVVNQMGRAEELIVDLEEKTRLATLCLQAGRKAMLTSAFSAASLFLDLGIRVLDKRHWRDAYELSLGLYNAAAEAEYCNANLERMDALLEEIFKNARCFSDTVQARITKICSFGAHQELQKAIDTGLGVLNEQGIKFPHKVSLVHILFSIWKTKRLLAGMSNRDILSLPDMTDPDKLDIMRVLNMISAHAYLGRPEIMPIIGLHSIQLSLRYGMSGMSAYAFCGYGATLVCLFGKVDDGYRFSDVSLRLLARFRAKQWLPRVYTCAYALVRYWKDSVRDCLNALQYAHRVGLETGDIEIAIIAGHGSIMLRFYTGHPLPSLIIEMENMRELAVAYKQDGAFALLQPNYQEALNFMGLSENPLVLTGKGMNEATAIENAQRTKNATVLFLIHLFRCELAFFMQEYELAKREAQCAHRSNKDLRWDLWRGMLFFYEGMADLALAQERCGLFKTQSQLASRNLRKVQKFARHAPKNFGHLLNLMEAEILCLTSKVDEAMAHYQDAIELTAEMGYIHYQALAHERAALALFHHGRESDGSSYLVKARSLYEEWGATIKVSQVDDMMKS